MKNDIRHSNFELLRIVSMIMIIAHHFAVHGTLKIYTDSPYTTFFGASTVCQTFACLLIPGGGVGVGLFFIITGYFVGRPENKKTLESIAFLRQILESVVFYAILISVLSFVFYLTNGFPDCSADTLLYSYLRLILAPVNSQAWWYVTSYIILLFFAPYSQSIIGKIKSKGFIMILSFLLVFELIIPFMLDTSGSPIVRSLFFYFLGAYFYYLCQRTDAIIKIKLVYKMVMLAIAVLLWVLSAYFNMSIVPFASGVNRVKKFFSPTQFGPIMVRPER